MATILKLSLTNFDSNENLSLYEGLLKGEIEWLFNRKYPAEVLFIPHAYDGNYYNTYIQKVRTIFGKLGIQVRLLTQGNPADLIIAASAIVIGGGSLSKLLSGTVSYFDILKAKIQAGTPYLGWNEGSVLVSPYYVVPPLIPVSSTCIGAIQKQIYCHYVDTSANRVEINNFFINHVNDQVPVTEIICLKNKPGGTGIQLEDDGAGLLYNVIPGTDPPTVFAFKNGNTIEI